MQTFSTRRHKLKLQLVAVSSIVSQGRHTPALRKSSTPTLMIKLIGLQLVIYKSIFLDKLSKIIVKFPQNYRENLAKIDSSIHDIFSVRYWGDDTDHQCKHDMTISYE